MILPINKFLILGSVSFLLCTSALYANCDSEKLNKIQELQCLKKQETQHTREAEILYAYLRNVVPKNELPILEKDHRAWLDNMDASCLLTRDAYNSWGADYVPDSDFQNAQCRVSTAEGQADFYKSLICSDSIADGTKPHCNELKKILDKTIGRISSPKASYAVEN